MSDECWTSKSTGHNKQIDRRWKKKKKKTRGLTGNGAQVEVVPDDLLQLVVQRAFLEAQVEVAAQVLVDHAPWMDNGDALT